MLALLNNIMEVICPWDRYIIQAFSLTNNYHFLWCHGANMHQSIGKYFQVRLDAYKYTTQVRRPLAQKVFHCNLLNHHLNTFYVSLLVFCLFLILTFFPTPFINTFTLLNHYFPPHYYFSSQLLFPTVAWKVQSIGAWAGILQAIVYFAIIVNVRQR